MVISWFVKGTFLTGTCWSSARESTGAFHKDQAIPTGACMPYVTLCSSSAAEPLPQPPPPAPFTPPPRVRAGRRRSGPAAQKGGWRISFTLRPAPLPSRSGAMTPFPGCAAPPTHPKVMRRPPFPAPSTPRTAAAAGAVGRALRVRRAASPRPEPSQGSRGPTRRRRLPRSPPGAGYGALGGSFGPTPRMRSAISA